MKKSLGVSRRSLLLFAVGKSVTPKAIVTDTVIDTIVKTVVGPEVSWALNFSQRLLHAKQK